ncbi:hypothetical protein ABT288_35860 [Streptomyces sp. NPDC001093]
MSFDPVGGGWDGEPVGKGVSCSVVKERERVGAPRPARKGGARRARGL